MHKITCLAALFVLSSCATEPEQYQARKTAFLNKAHILARADSVEAIKAHPKIWTNGCWSGDAKIKNGNEVKLVRFQDPEKPKYASVLDDSEGSVYDDRVRINLNGVFQQGDETAILPMVFEYSIGQEGKLTPSRKPLLPQWPSCLVSEDPIAKFRKSPQALKAIQNHEIYIGMPEEALLASLGNLSFNLMNYKGRETKQYVNGNHYYYVEHGKVTDFQLF